MDQVVEGAENGTFDDDGNSGSVVTTGGKLVLNGNEGHVHFAHNLIPESGNFSVTFFAQAPSMGSESAFILSQGGFSETGFNFGYNGSESGFHINLGSSISDAGVAFPNDGLFHHYALVRDTEASRIYIDGTLVSGLLGTLSWASGGQTTVIGGQFGGSTDFFTGSIDELRIYSGTLTTGEVQSLAAIPEPSVSAAFAALAALATGLILRRRRAA
jgi:hypothetical protein